MSIQINPQMVDLDQTAGAFLLAYIEAKAKVKEWSEKADLAAEQVKAAMGESEIGLVNGKERIHWTTYETTRVDLTKLRESFSAEDIAKVQTTTTARRFVIID